MNHPTKNDSEPVLLMCPRVSNNKIQKSVPPTECAIGGIPSYYNHVDFENPSCEVCSSTMFMLAQIYAPLEGLDRTLYVFGCNNGECSGKEGSFKCIRDQRKIAILDEAEESKIDNYANDNIDDDDDDIWDCDDDEDVDSKLESIMIANELKQLQLDDKSCVKSMNQDISVSKNNEEKVSFYLGRTSDDTCFLPQMSLDFYNENFSAAKYAAENNGDDLIGISTYDDNISAKLLKYLEDEDDPDIVTSINQSLSKKGHFESNTSSSGSDNGERDERLPRKQRIFLEFIERIKLEPSQVVRYIYDGLPLWSAPMDSVNLKSIPPCHSCGNNRSFEFQLMPSMLYLLQVHKYTSFDRDQVDISDLFQSKGGMSWGVIAIYSCPNSCDCKVMEEYIVIQDAMDGSAKEPLEHVRDISDDE